MKKITAFINLLSGLITIITAFFSFYFRISETQIVLPSSFNEPLSLLRFLIAGVLLMACNFVISYPCSIVLKGRFNPAIRSVLYGIIVLVSSWLNIFIIKDMLFAEAFTYNFSFKFGYTIILLFSILLFKYFIKKHIEDSNYLEDELRNDLLPFIFIIYSIIWFTTLFFDYRSFQ